MLRRHGTAESMRTGLLSQLPRIETAGCVMLAALLVWKGILPGWHSLNSDFPNYYLVARLLREGYSLDRIYDWIWLQRVKDHWGLSQPLVGFAGLTPFSALPIVPLSIFSALTAKRLWMVANLLFLGGSVELLTQLTSLGRRRVWLLVLLAVFPLRTSFLLGQMHILVLFLVVLAYFFHRTNRRPACGVCLAIAGALKIYPLLFGFYFLWKRQWRSLFSMICAGLLLLGISYLWMGGDVLHTYATQILPRSLQGEILDPYNQHTASAAALFHRLFILEPSLNPTPLLNSHALYALLYPLWQMVILIPFLAIGSRLPTITRMRGGECERLRIPLKPKSGLEWATELSRLGSDPLEWAAFVFALLVLSPVPASYHFVVAAFSVVLLVDLLLRRRAHRAALLAVFFYSMISMVEFLPHDYYGVYYFLAPARLWCELLLWGVFLWSLWFYRTRATNRPIRTLRFASLWLIATAGWTAGVCSNYLHFAFLDEDVARRLPAYAKPYLASSPRPMGDRTVYVAMQPDRYRVLDQAGSEIWRGNPGRVQSDQLSFAGSHNAAIWAVELASAEGSQIAIYLGQTPFGMAQGPVTIIADAESPALSSDGTTVAFIRESKGHGTLWTVHLDERTGQPQSKAMQMADDTDDIRDVTFTPIGEIMFTAKAEGRAAIFSLVPGGQPQLFMLPDENADSPAVSPDGKSIAFRKMVHNRFQLGYVDLKTAHERMLTFGDCNVFSPGWVGSTRIAYGTDCGRGFGLSALASASVD